MWIRACVRFSLFHSVSPSLSCSQNIKSHAVNVHNKVATVAMNSIVFKFYIHMLDWLHTTRINCNEFSFVWCVCSQSWKSSIQHNQTLSVFLSLMAINTVDLSVVVVVMCVILFQQAGIGRCIMADFKNRMKKFGFSIDKCISHIQIFVECYCALYRGNMDTWNKKK